MGFISTIKNLISGCLKFLGLKNAILIEMEPNCRPNTEAVFYEILKRPWISRYLIVLFTKHPDALAPLKRKNVRIVKRPRYEDSRKDKLRAEWFRLRAVMILDENEQIKKDDRHAVHVYFSHGSTLKSLKNYYNLTPDTDYMLNQAEFWKPVNSTEFRVPVEKLVTLGFPRNDDLFSSEVQMPKILGKHYNKVVVWYPTYRQHANHNSACSCTDGIALPIIHDEAAAQQINAFASQRDVLLLVKPHPAQDMSRIRSLDLDHIRVIDDSFFEKHNCSSYSFLAKTDALITDYSSVIFDYLLTGKPIALTFEDIEIYRKTIGFAFDPEMLRSCCVMLDSVADFESFFDELVSGNDPMREKREEVMHLTNQYTDGNSTKRVVDWIGGLIGVKQ